KNVTASGLGQRTETGRVPDGSGNKGTSNAVMFTLDTVAPTVAITSSGGVTNQANQTISGTVGVADAGSTITILDGSTQIGTTTETAKASCTGSVTSSGEGRAAR